MKRYKFEFGGLYIYYFAPNLGAAIKELLDHRGVSSFKLSKLSDLSPTTTRKIYADEKYIPSPDVLERICLSLEVQPGDILQITPKLEVSVAVCSGVLASGI
jgi:DNA-binding Xre family transcriptional regulator